MPWHVVGDQLRSVARTQAVAEEYAEGDGHFLGVAVFCIQSHPDSRQGRLRLMELDESLNPPEGEEEEGGTPTPRQGSSDDLVAELQFAPQGEADVRVRQRRSQSADRPSDEDIRLRLEFRLHSDPADDDQDAAPPAHRCLDIRVPYEAVSDEHKVHFAVLGQREEFSDQTPVYFAATVWFTPDPGNEWNWRRRPNAGQTADGFPIEEDRYVNRQGQARTKRAVRIASNVRLEFSTGGPSGEKHYGIYYRGHAPYGALRRAKQMLQAEYASDSYLKLLTEAYDVLGEGAPSAINTYDNCIITMGAGWSGMSKGLNMLLRYLGESPAGPALHEAFADYLATDEQPSPLRLADGEEHVMRFNSSWTGDDPRCWSAAAWRLRAAVGAWAGYVRLAESPQYGVHFSKADIKALVEYDSGYHCKPHVSRQSDCERCTRTASDDDITNVRALADLYTQAKDHPERSGADHEKALALRALAGIAVYMHHGRPGIAKPVKDLLYVWNNANTPSAMIALLVKIHIEDCVSVSEPPDGRKLLDRAMNNKLPHFQSGYRVDCGNPNWTLSTEEIRREIPCYAGPRGANFAGYRLWQHGPSPSESAPNGVSVHLERAERARDNGHYDFGRRRRRR